ncbi:MAG: phenylalanine--tRNA ligase subunit beta [Candidatus Woesearchaeota archaeon]|jgi:phenylalanyl-tRNA synthetase beta chain
MTAIDFSIMELVKAIGKDLSEDYLSDRLTMLGVQVEGVSGDIMQCDIAPNRPDLLSQQGVNRAMRSFLGIELGLRDYKSKNSNYKVVVDESVRKVRPFTCCAVVKNIKFDDEKVKEIIQIQEKLHGTFGRNRKKIAIGIYPMEKISFPISFVGRDPKKQKFIPLEFDKELDGLQILTMHPTGREFAHLLDGKEVFPYFIDGKGDVMSMPPIINSDHVGKIELTTTDVFIECSGFDIRPLSFALNMIVTSLADMGGEIYNVEVDYYGEKKIMPDLSVKEMSLDVSYVNKRLGLTFSSRDLCGLLEKMGFGIASSNVESIVVKIPCYRTDILHQIDFVEDIAIAYGYDNIDAIIPDVATIGSEDPFELFKNKIVDILIGFGLIETKCFHLINKDDATKKILREHDDIVELINSVTIEYNSLRRDLLPSSLLTLKLNKHHEYPQTFFEIGDVFFKDIKKEAKVLEKSKLCVVLSDTSVNFTKAKQILDGLFLALDVKFTVERTDNYSFISGRCGKIIVDGNASVIEIGVVGEIHPQVLYNFEVFMPVSCFEIDLNELFSLIKKK